MRSWKRAIVTLIFSLLTLFSTATAFAENAIPLTPVADVETANALECSIEPANLDRVREIAGDAIDDPDAVLAEETPIEGGEIVTGEGADATIELMGQLIACINQFDYPRLLALLSDGLIERAAYDIVGSIPAEDEAEETPDPEAFAIIVDTSDVYEQPDGRLAYSVTIGSYNDVNSDNIPVPFQILQIVSIQQQGEWKIDDLRMEYIADDDPNCNPDAADGCGATPIEGPDCGSDGTDSCLPPEDAPYIEGEGYAGWLMTAEAAHGAGNWLLGNDGETAESFQPTEAQVATAEAALAAFVADQPWATPRLIEELNTGLYERQYLGFNTPDGPMLVINAYCDGSPYGDAAQTIYAVDDGGDCFWQAVFDLEEGIFTSLKVNGEA